MPTEASRNNIPRLDGVLWTARGSHRARYLGVATCGFVPSPHPRTSCPGDLAPSPAAYPPGTCTPPSVVATSAKSRPLIQEISSRGAQAVAPFLPLLFSGQLLFSHQLARLLELHQGARGIAHTVSQEVAPRHSHSSSAYAWAQSAGKLSGRLSRHHCLHCDLLVSCRSRASKRASLNGRLHSTRRVQHQGLHPR